MKKTIFIIIGLCVVFCLVALAFFLNQKTNTTPSPAQGHVSGFPVAQPVEVSTTTSVSSTGLMTITTASGSLQTNNFMADPTTTKDPINSGYYYLGYHTSEGILDATATSTPPYIISYISSTQYFNIALLQEPIGSVRNEMERYLMNRLGIPENQMCLLNYMVSVPNAVNSQFAGKSLGFSFCPGAVVLPQ